MEGSERSLDQDLYYIKMFSMKNLLIKIVLACCVLFFSNGLNAQAKKRTATKRVATKRTTTRKTTNSKTKAVISPSTAKVDTIAKSPVLPRLISDTIRKSLRNDGAVEANLIKDKTPLAYQHLREDDAVYRERIWREIDIREKMNQSFRYSADADNGNQRFISILLHAIQNGPDSGGVTAFSNNDDRFTTPLSVAQVSALLTGGTQTVDIYDTLGNVTGHKDVTPEINLDSTFTKFRIKEEVVFDKQSSRLFWRILGIAPVKKNITSTGIELPESEVFWVYYPDLRPILAKYEVYNGKNMGARMTWEELFESRFFYGRVIKSTIDNPYDRSFDQYPGLKNSKLFQLYEGQKVTDKIFNYEQNLWSY